MNRVRSSTLTSVLIALLTAASGAAQTATTSPQPAPAPAASPLNFSGVIFGSYNYQMATTPAPLPGQVDNQFILDRAYLTFRMPAGDRTSIRITTDMYQTTEGSPNAFTIRAKYAYLQYDQPKFSNGASFLARIGILHNVVIDHDETFWPRYISQVPLERAGFFASADMGLAAQLTLPSKMGEVYATIVNGPGYTSREKDRFKDYAIRLSLTPLANSVDMPLLQSFTISTWGYKGATASGFVNSGAGQLSAVGEALDRSRAGVFVGLKDPRLVLGAEFAQRHDGGEQGLNTTASPRTATEITGRLLSGYTVVRPFALANASGKSPFGLVARYDRVTPASSTSGYVLPAAPATDNAYHILIGGLFYDLSPKAQIALDYQEALNSATGLALAPPTQSKTVFAHFVVNF
ncbi:MAG: hypothetical protein ABJA80_06460 [bacterium]